jgi:type IV secretion system protein VirB8
MDIKTIFNTLLLKRQPSVEKQTWEDERYKHISQQRNIFLIFAFLSIGCVIVIALTMVSIVNSKTINPFVIQIDQSTGAASIVNPLTLNQLTSYDSLSQYFIKKYIIARETYNPVDFDSRARKYIQLTSQPDIYKQYRSYISQKVNDPRIIYGANNVTYLKVKSWSKIDKKKHICRFSVYETLGAAKVYNKIAVVDINYLDSPNLSEEERDINPVGFLVTGYRVDDDNS